MGNNTIKLDWKEVKVRDMENIVIKIKTQWLDYIVDWTQLKKELVKLEGRTEEIA